MSEPLRVITQTESWKQEVKEDVVERLRELVSMAEAGEIQGIAYAAIGIDNTVITGFTKNNGQTAMIGGPGTRKASSPQRRVGMTTILIILLILILIGAFPAWPHSNAWGYGPSGIIGLVLVVLLVLMLLGRI